ncbi:hypothetical protein [Lacrimispora xylanisolvens]|uniref:hypothetical protein n=1 Tax=Lacrimispora xylanisolvens TaxID=384636 RepID=UPI0024027D66
MSKKLFRIFMVVCLMLGMTTTTAFAETRTITRTNRYYILNNGHYDYIVHDNSDNKPGALVTVNTVYTYDSKNRENTIQLSSVNATITGYNANKYYCETKQLSPKDVRLILETDDNEIGYIRVYITSGHGNLKTYCVNYRGPH